jgi:hypothetical protein
MLVRHSTRKIRFPINHYRQSDLSRSRNAWLPPGLGRWVSLERLLVANGLIKLVPVLWKSGRCTWDLIYIIILENIQQSTIPSNKSVNSRLPECGECHCRSSAGWGLFTREGNAFRTRPGAWKELAISDPPLLEPPCKKWPTPIWSSISMSPSRNEKRTRKRKKRLWYDLSLRSTIHVEVNVLACWHKPT